MLNFYAPSLFHLAIIDGATTPAPGPDPSAALRRRVLAAFQQLAGAVEARKAQQRTNDFYARRGRPAEAPAKTASAPESGKAA
jgi:hypothetical protein